MTSHTMANDMVLKLFKLQFDMETLGQKCLKNTGTLLWNEVPTNLKSYVRTTLFKHTVKVHLAL